MRKKMFVVIAAFLMAAVLLAGCYKSASTPPVESNQPTLAMTQTPWVVTEEVTVYETVVVEITSTPQPTQMPTVTAEPTEKPTEEVMSHSWEIILFDGATDQMVGWTDQIQELAPELWPEFPNVDNPSANFQAKDGLEYGMAESSFCQQDETCDIVVPAMHYRLITGDYDVAGYECSAGEDSQGCALMLINVGTVSASFEDASVDSGWTVFGRYWNGDQMPVAIWAGLSHVSGNMLNLNSALNPGGTNAGANCSSPNGCEQVEARFIITSGNEVLMTGITTIER